MVRLSWDPFLFPTPTCRISLIYAVNHWPKKDPSQLVTVASTESNLLVDVEEGEERVYQVAARAEQASTGRMDEVKSPVVEFATMAEVMATTTSTEVRGMLGSIKACSIGMVLFNCTGPQRRGQWFRLEHD